MAYGDHKAKCFYFKRRDDSTIVCQGPVPDTSIHWIWNTKEDAIQQEIIFCCKHYDRCELFRCIKQNLCEDDE